MRIDSHHSFSGRYPLEYLDTILKRNRFDGSVLVTEALTQSVPQFVRGIVVIVDLHDPQLPGLLDEYQRHPKFRGVCHCFAGDLPEGLAELERRDIPIDALAPPAEILRIVERFPLLRIVIDHVGCVTGPTLTLSPPSQSAHNVGRTPWSARVPADPPPGSGNLSSQREQADEGVGRGPGGPPYNAGDQWALDLERAARFPQVFCKLSAIARLSPSPGRYVQHALAVFGPSRLMFGSDWPAGLPETSWKASLAAFTQAIGAQTIEVRERMLGGTAERFYRL